MDKHKIKRFLDLRKKNISIARNIKIGTDTCFFCEYPVRLESDLNLRGASIGSYTYMRSGGRLSAAVKTIGRYCSIATDVIMGDGNHPTNWLSTHPFQYGAAAVHKMYTKKPDFPFNIKPTGISGKIHVGNDVWIGSGVKVMRGVTISDGAILAAGAIVTKDVPPYAIVGGIPAKVIKYRFEKNVIDQLLDLQWWNYDADCLLGIPFDNIDSAISTIREQAKDGKLSLIKDRKIKVDGNWILNG